jgi:putative FmdB family regulatory protein
MPIYEYQCGACGHRLEKLQKITDSPLVDCPDCSETALTKLVSAAGFRLKGKGWYETDFKTGSKRNLVGGEKHEEHSNEPVSPTSTDKPSSSESTSSTKTADNKSNSD